jgi:hypothetical protein
MTEQECIEKVSQAMRDAFKHSKGKSIHSTYISAVDRGSQKLSSKSHDRGSSDFTSRSISLDVARRPFTVFREDTDRMSDRLVLQQQHSLLPARIDALTSASSPYLSEASAPLPANTNEDTTSLIYKHSKYVGQRVTGIRSEILSRNLDNTVARCRSISPLANAVRIPSKIPQNVLEMYSKDPTVNIPKQQTIQQQSQAVQQQKHSTEKESGEEEHDSFDDTINEFLGPLQQEDFESAFKVD